MNISMYIDTKFKGSIIYVDWLLFFWVQKSTFLNKWLILARGRMYLDRKINFENAITLVLVGIFSFSKNWGDQYIIFYLKMQ